MKDLELVVVSKSVQRRVAAQKRAITNAPAEKLVDEIHPLPRISVENALDHKETHFLSVGPATPDFSALMRLFVIADPDEALEVGTGNGKIALCMAVNVPGCKVITVGDGIRKGKAFASSGVSHSVVMLKEDKPWHLRLNAKPTFFFLNGMTSYAAVREDFKRCIRIAGERQCTFVWGKYDGHHPHLTKFLVELSNYRKILHLEGTNLACWEYRPTPPDRSSSSKSSAT